MVVAPLVYNAILKRRERGVAGMEILSLAIALVYPIFRK